MNEKYDFIKVKIAALHEIVSDLTKQFDNKRKFTLDGRLVGDIGEIIAEMHYDIILDPKSRHHYDAKCGDKEIQIKVTMKESLTFKNCVGYYLGLKINTDGTFEEIYNGPASVIHQRYNKRKDIGTKLLSFKNSELSKLSVTVNSQDKIPQRNTILI